MNKTAFHTILFHALYRKEDAAKSKHPYMFISVNEFEACVRTFLDSGIKFINPSDLLKDNIIPDCRQVLLTFDDGYFNNFHALKVLEKYSIEALFFIVKHQIIEKKLFWWDVYFKNRIKEVSFQTLYEEIQELKKLERDEIETRLIDRFGNTCFEANDDFDRPMTEAELLEFSRHPLVNIGAHSASHEILTNCSPDKVRAEIQDCKDYLEKITGKTISFISYPNGNFNDDIVALAEELGFRFGITTAPGPNDYEKLKNANNKLILKRNVFPVPGSSIDIVKQIEDFKNHSLLQ